VLLTPPIGDTSPPLGDRLAFNVDDRGRSVNARVRSLRKAGISDSIVADGAVPRDFTDAAVSTGEISIALATQRDKILRQSHR